MRKKNIEKQNQNINKQNKLMSKAKNTQSSICYERMIEDGICYLGNGSYSRTFKFSDINYQTACRDEQIDVFSRYCEFLNSFDSEIQIQMTVFNRHIDPEDFKNGMLIPLREDQYNAYRTEFNMMLADKAMKGQNSIIREKYITLTTQSDSYESAVMQFSRLEVDIMGRLKSLGCEVYPLNGLERLELIQRILKPTEKFTFSYDYLLESNLTTKDFIAPHSLNFSDKNYVEIDNYYNQTIGIIELPTDLSDRLITDLTDLSGHITVSLHMTSVEKDKALAIVKNKLVLMEQQKVTEHKKALKNGYDPDMIPYELKYSITEATNLLEDLREKNQKMLKVTILINLSAPTFDELEQLLLQIRTVANRHSCKLINLSYLQDNALNSVLPVGVNLLELKRTLTTSSTGIFIPFTTQELFQEHGSYYGLNAISRNLIFFDRKTLKNANGFILGTPGSGKSFTAKEEIVKTLLTTEDDVIAIDPEREYTPIANLMKGEVVHISAGSKNYINPFDITLDYSDEDNPLLLKSEFILSLFEVLIGGREGLSATEKGLIDRAVKLTYAKYFANPNKHEVPTLKDFYKILTEQPEAEAKQLALSMEIFVDGSLSVFSNQTNINLDNRFIVFDIKDLGKQLKTMGMLIVLDQIWNRITKNRAIGRRTWIYIDEIYILFQNDYSANYLFELYKRARKWGAIPTGITQNVEDLLLSDVARNMLSNSEFTILLNQASSDREKLAELLNLSPQQLSYVTNVDHGHGLLRAGGNIIPFIDDFPKNTELYRVMTTKIEEVVQE